MFLYISRPCCCVCAGKNSDGDVVSHSTEFPDNTALTIDGDYSTCYGEKVARFKAGHIYLDISFQRTHVGIVRHYEPAGRSSTVNLLAGCTNLGKVGNVVTYSCYSSIASPADPGASDFAFVDTKRLSLGDDYWSTVNGYVCELEVLLLCTPGFNYVESSTSCELCPPGLYCTGFDPNDAEYRSDTLLCPAGRYGPGGSVDSDCAGACPPGYHCEAGSSSPTDVECGGVQVYCPAGVCAASVVC